jgi:hypothetical protein
MFFRKWRRSEWASLLTSITLLAGVLTAAATANAAPLQAPSGVQPCSAFPAENQTAIKLPGTLTNDSCVVATIVATIKGCTLEVRLVVNVTTKSPVLSYKWVRRADRRSIESHAKPTKYASTTSDNYSYASHASSVYLNTYYSWPLRDCDHPKYDWSGTASLTIRTKKQRPIFGIASQDAGQADPPIDGAVIFP